MRELKTITEANALVDAADKFDDIYLRIEALANHAHELIKYAGEEQAVGDWWQGMQNAMQKMQAVTDEIRQPKLPGMESVEEQPQDAPQVQEETQMSNINDMIASLSKLAGLPVAEGSKPDFLDVDKDGNKKEPFKDAVDDKEEKEDDVKEGVELDEKAKSPYAIGMAQAMKSTGDEPPLEKSTIKKAHEIAKAVKKNESVELDECGMPMAVAYNDAMDSYAGEENGPAEAAGDMYKLDVKTANKTMSFITDNPEEIIQVLKASGVDVKSSEAVGYQPPAQVPVPQVNSTPASPAPAEEQTDEAVGDTTRSSTGGTITQTQTGQVHKAGSGNYGGTSDNADDESEDDEEDKKVAESIAILRKMSGFAPVSEGKFGNSVAGSKGDPRVVGDTIDFALAGQGNAKSGRGDKGLSTTGDNPLGRNDRDVTESIHREFAEFLKESK